MSDPFDSMLAEGLRDRARHAETTGRGFGDVRRRVRHRRQRQAAVGLLPAAAMLGWVGTRQGGGDPLQPATDGASSCASPAVGANTVTTIGETSIGETSTTIIVVPPIDSTIEMTIETTIAYDAARDGTTTTSTLAPAGQCYDVLVLYPIDRTADMEARELEYAVEAEPGLWELVAIDASMLPESYVVATGVNDPYAETLAVRWGLEVWPDSGPPVDIDASRYAAVIVLGVPSFSVTDPGVCSTTTLPGVCADGPTGESAPTTSIDPEWVATNP